MKQTKSEIMTNRKLAKLKKLALDMYIGNHITQKMCVLVQRLSNTDDLEYIALITALYEKYLRVRGYYKKYPKEKEITNREIDLVIKDYKERSLNNGKRIN